MAYHNNENHPYYLTWLHAQGVTVRALAEEQPNRNVVDNSRLVDTEFSIDIGYYNRCNGTVRSETYTLQRSAEIDELIRTGYGTVVLLDKEHWLEEIGVNNDVAYYAFYDVVGDSMTQSLEEVETEGRKSLAMMVEIKVLGEEQQEAN